jgi:hypothetical protein
MTTRERLQYEIDETARLLGFDVDQVSDLIWKYGCAFAERYYAPRSASLAPQCELYWTWWLSVWRETDKWLFRAYPIAALGSDAWPTYCDLHNPKRITIGITFQPWTEVTRQVNKLLITSK